MQSLAKHGLLAAMFLALALSGCSSEKKSADGKDDNGKGTPAPTIDQSSPQKVAESFKKAILAKDWKTALACVADNSQDMVVLIMIADADLAAGNDEEKLKSKNAILKKHGIKNDGKTPGFPEIKDKAGLLADLSAWFEKAAPAKKPKLVVVAEAELSEFKTNGDTATATVSMGGKTVRKPAQFKKMDGKWYVDFGEMPGGGRSKAGPAPFPKTKSP